ncbi:hypothetical protein [Rheinheimera mangrovi]|uniref:hypothetical protein n=1 Tax=Rheinheimera mangrovi TaxID=2498451 RepID=UPI0013DF19FF|nr:hypothetical protein [Rheinheimera mangrovi]
MRDPKQTQLRLGLLFLTVWNLKKLWFYLLFYRDMFQEQKLMMLVHELAVLIHLPS